MKRYNRIDIELSSKLTDTEYKVLDMVLYQSNLTDANDGFGFKFHVRKVAEMTGIGRTTVGRMFKRWEFITKVGKTFDSYFVFSYEKYEEFVKNLKKVVPPVNQPCPTSELTLSPGCANLVPPVNIIQKNIQKSYTEEQTGENFEHSYLDDIIKKEMIDRAKENGIINPIISENSIRMERMRKYKV